MVVLLGTKYQEILKIYFSLLMFGFLDVKVSAIRQWQVSTELFVGDTGL